MKKPPWHRRPHFATLRDIGADPRFIVTSPIKISFFVERADADGRCSHSMRRSTSPRRKASGEHV